MTDENKQIGIGNRVRLKEDHRTYNKTYLKGHEFTIYGSSYRGWNLIDDDRNKIDECLFIEHKFELVKDYE